MKKIIQIFTGGWQNQLYEPEKICERIRQIGKKMKVDGVIIGWNLNPEIYRQVGSCLKEQQIEMYLWLPVFSEIVELGETEPLVDLWGHKTGKYVLQEGESFEFLCPSSKKNRALLYEIYEKYFADCGFDGVFLDKIRTQSYISGAEDVLGCCCPNCIGKFKEQGFDPARLEALIQKEGMQEAMKPERFDLLTGFHFVHPEAEQFFDAKCRVYLAELEKTIAGFRSRGLKIGLDVYAPSMARLVGQDVKGLLELADFVKPMMYRRTNAPAGIGFEYEAMKRALQTDEFDRTPGMEEPLSEMTDETLARGLQIEGREGLYPGIEVNYREDIARTDSEYVERSIKAASSAGCGGIVYAWDVMLAPEEHLVDPD